MNVREREINIGRWFGGITFFDYQWVFGVSVRKWSTGLAIRIYFGPMKLWLFKTIGDTIMIMNMNMIMNMIMIKFMNKLKIKVKINIKDTGGNNVRMGM